MYFKYPRTYHLPFSLGASGDDKLLTSVDHFVGKTVVVTEKLDGEATSMYRDIIHARSTSSKHHPSRSWVKQLHAEICNDIPDGWRICGENLFAMHSIFYQNLPSYFFVYGIYDEKNNCLSWSDTESYASLLGLQTVPVLYRGVWDEEKVRACWTGKSVFQPSDQEGYVVRVEDSFLYSEQDEGVFSKYTAKYVRENHIQTDEHWMSQPVVPNLLQGVHK